MTNSPLDDAKSVLQIEGESIINAIQNLTADFTGAVSAIITAKGRTIVTGVGKSANIATKIVATLNSTGTPAMFLHAGDAKHGDLGMVTEHDVILCLSKSGETSEIKELLPLFKQRKVNVIAITGNPNSTLGKFANFVLNAHVNKEACPNNLAPTASAVVQLALGDALAMALQNKRGFSNDDFAQHHPGGSLGKNLTLLIDRFIGDIKPMTTPEANVSDVIPVITSSRLGATAVIDASGALAGIITDGDVRRMLEQDVDIKKLSAKDIMSANPLTVQLGSKAKEVLKTLNRNKISQIIVLDGSQYVGIAHLHDLIKEGLLDSH